MSNQSEEKADAKRRVFLSTEWRDLVLLNYEVQPDLLAPYLPQGVELDSCDGKTYISLVGLRFAQTKMLGRLAVPFHTDFEEVNLRFYVRRRSDQEMRRGVVFIREIVPLHAVAQIARTVYGENYLRLPMRHSTSNGNSPISIEYQWLFQTQWNRLYADADCQPSLPAEGSIEQFITEHYWGYARQREGRCVEYHVSHAPWRVCSASLAGFKGDPDRLYGPNLGHILKRPPDSAFVADGSPVLIFRGSQISPDRPLPRE
ncbi:MAG: YqjF family protein [Candidatus Acidiferrales bacterium]